MTLAVCFRSYCQNEFGWIRFQKSFNCVGFLDKKAVEMQFFFLICNLKNGDKLPSNILHVILNLPIILLSSLC